MATMNAHDVEKRLAALERQNRWLKGIGVFVVAFLGVGLLMGAKNANRVVEAEKFVLKDEKGISRAELGMTASGPGLRLCDEGGIARLGLDVDKGGPGISIYDETGKTRVVLGIGKDGPVIELSDEVGRHRVSLGFGKDGPGLELCDGAGKVIWKAPHHD